MLKLGTIEDLDLVLNMAYKFAEASPYKDLVDKEKIKNIAIDFLSTENERKVVILYEDKGMLIGSAHPFLFGEDYTATELVWWVEPEARKAGVGAELIKAFEYWANKIGCRFITLCCLDDEVGKFYEKKGFTLYERAYMKCLQ